MKDIKAVLDRFGCNLAAVNINLLAIEGKFIELTSLYDFVVISFTINLRVLSQLQEQRPLIHITEKYEHHRHNHIIW